MEKRKGFDMKAYIMKKEKFVIIERKPLERLLNYIEPYEFKHFEEHNDKRSRHIYKDIKILADNLAGILNARNK